MQALDPAAGRLDSSGRPGEVDPALRDAYDELHPDDFAAAAHLVERDATVDRLAPGAGDEALLLHRQDLDAATTALETGRIGDLAERFDAPARHVGINRAPKIQSLSQFIARNGGLELSPEASYFDLDKVFVPGGGALARKSGRSIDGYWRERLMEEGYLPKGADGYVGRDIRDELFAALRAESQGQKTYRAADRAEIADREDAAAFERGLVERDRELEFQANRIRQEYRDGGLGDIDDTPALYEAAEMLARGDETDGFAALERVYLSRENDALSPQTRLDYDLPDYDGGFDALLSGTARPARAEAGRAGEGGAEPGQAQGSRGESADGAQPGRDGAQEGGQPVERAPLGALALGRSDPQAAARLADIDRALAKGDLELYVAGPDGALAKTSARAHLAALDADAKAALELKACLGDGGAP